WVSGPLGRSVADVQLALRVLAGPDERDRFSLLSEARDEPDALRDPPSLRLGWCRAPAGVAAEPVVERAALDALGKLAATGRVSLVQSQRPLVGPKKHKAAKDALHTLMRAECLAECLSAAGLKGKADFDKQADKLSPTFRKFVEPAWRLALTDYLA